MINIQKKLDKYIVLKNKPLFCTYPKSGPEKTKQNKQKTFQFNFKESFFTKSEKRLF